MGFQSYNPVGSANQGQAQAGTPILGLTGQSSPAPPPAAPAPQTYKAPTLPYASNTPGFNGTGQTPQYGQQSPNFLGQGQYVAPLFPINDQAITGAPSQGAGANYGLNSVWGSLQNEIARSQGPGPMSMVNAPQGQAATYQAALGNAALANAAQGGYATAAPTGLSTAGNTIGQQQGLAGLLAAQAAGGGAPSAADLQLKQGMEQGLGAQLAAMGSQRGVTNAALMNRNAADQAAAGQANLNAQMGIQRAQESQAAQQALGGVLSAQGQQAAGINQTAAQLAQQNNQFNAANAENAMLANTGYAQQATLANQAAQNAMTGGNLSALNAANLGNAQLGQQMTLSNLGYQNQDVLANQAAQLGNAQFQNNMLNAALGAQTGIGEANRAAATADQQMQIQQMIAANQVNEQAYQAAANANANLTGAVVNGVTSLGAAGVNALGNSGGGGGSSVGPSPVGAGEASGELSTSSDGTFSGTLNNFNPYGLPGYGNGYSYSDENLKSGIEGGNPMMRSFLENYRKSTEPKIDVMEGDRFRNPTYGRAPGSASGGGGGIGSAIGGFLGGLAGTFVAPGVGTALGASAGSMAGGAIGNGVDPTSASGGGLQQTSQGSGVTADDLNQDYSQELAPDTVVSDESEKEAVTSGSRGMQALLSQANAQTQAQNNKGAQNNAFMESSLPPQAQVDTQMPSGGGLPPWMQGGSGVGYGMPQAPQGGGIYGGGIQSYGGYTGGGVMPQYMASSPAVDQSLAMAHPQTAGMQGPGAVTWSPQAYSQIGADALAQQAHTYQGAPASNVSRPGIVLSDERQKVTNTDGEPDPATDARFGELGMLKRPDGDVSTEISITVTDPRLNGGAPTNIPTLVKGQKNVDSLLAGKDPTREQENLAILRAVQRQKEGAYLPQFSSIPEAVSAAEVRSQTKGQMMDMGQDVLGSRPIAAPQAPAPVPPFVESRRQHEANNIFNQYPEVGATVQSGPYAGLPSTFSGPPPSAAPPSFWDRAKAGLMSLSDERQKRDVQGMLDQLHAYQYRYKNPDMPGAMPGKRLGVMAQDLEKSPLGQRFVRDTPQGKMVDYGQMAGTQLAASAMLNDRLNQHEEMLKALARSR